MRRCAPYFAGAALLAALHYAATLAALAFRVAIGMRDFDQPAPVSRSIGEILFAVFQGLAWPIALAALERPSTTPTMGHAIVILNSALWAVVVTMAVAASQTRARRRRSAAERTA